MQPCWLTELCGSDGAAGGSQGQFGLKSTIQNNWLYEKTKHQHNGFNALSTFGRTCERSSAGVQE